MGPAKDCSCPPYSRFPLLSLRRQVPHPAWESPQFLFFLSNNKRIKTENLENAHTPQFVRRKPYSWLLKAFSCPFSLCSVWFKSILSQVIGKSKVSSKLRLMSSPQTISSCLFSVCVYMCGAMPSTVHLPEDNLWELDLVLLHAGSDWTQIVRLDSQCLHPLSCHPSPPTSTWLRGIRKRLGTSRDSGRYQRAFPVLTCRALQFRSGSTLSHLQELSCLVLGHDAIPYASHPVKYLRWPCYHLQINYLLIEMGPHCPDKLK